MWSDPEKIRADLDCGRISERFGILAENEMRTGVVSMSELDK